MAGEVSKDLTKRFLLDEDIVKAHDDGLIHFHDADYFAQHLPNCDLVNLEDMLQNGTVISGTMIEKPHSFSTACNIATQIVAQVASSQYGGQSLNVKHLGKYLKLTEDKYKEILSNQEDVEKMVMDRVAQIPEEERRSALILANYNASGISAAGTTFGRYWLATIGAKNVALELTQKVAPVSLEQIYAWDPEYIILAAEGTYTVEDVLTDPNLADCKAVVNGNVYRLPNQAVAWDSPVPGSVLGALWLANILHPDRLSETDSTTRMNDFYETLGRSFYKGN